MPAWARDQDIPLTPFQERFCQEYTSSGNAVESYKKVCQTRKRAVTHSYCQQRALQLMRYPKVKARVIELQADLKERNKVTADNIVKEMARLALSNMGKVASWDAEKITLKNSDEIDDDTMAAISEISQTKDGVKAKFYDKLGALNSLAKIMGMHREQVELTGKDGKPLIPENEPDEISIATFLAHCLDKQRRIAESATPMIEHDPDEPSEPDKGDA